MNSEAIPASREPFGWEELEDRIGDYLYRKGVSAPEAGRMAHAVIRMCAEAADSIDRDQLTHSAMDEAQTLLQTWQAGRREQLLPQP
jgi:hypothetical protein